MIDKIKRNFLNLILLFKSVFLDLILLYKNFIHWIISKVLIHIFGILLGVLLGLPFLIILILFIFFDPINWKDIVLNYISSGTLGLNILSEFYNNIFILLFEGIITFFGILFFILGYSYKSISFYKLSLDYLKGEKTPYFKNIYFNFAIIFRYLRITFFVILILLIPIIIFIISFFILVFIFGGIDNIYILSNAGQGQTFSIVLGIIALICILIFVYLAYRISFTYIILIDGEVNNYEKKALFYIKESFKISNGFIKLLKFIFFLIVFTIIMIPFDYLGDYISQTNSWGIINSYGIVMFLVFSGLFEMYIVSIYKKIMLVNSKSIVDETKENDVLETEVEKVSKSSIKLKTSTKEIQNEEIL
ncbi:MAG: hypothetical protein PHE25_03845 [Candidatus Gracilibacteria bacterium]|nr:hypothetical protein [Candidatus Gracilibacteria bacterium]